MRRNLRTNRVLFLVILVPVIALVVISWIGLKFEVAHGTGVFDPDVSEPEPTALAGHVADPANRPVADAHIFSYDTFGRRTTRRTDKDGNFRLEDPSPAYPITAYKDGYFIRSMMPNGHKRIVMPPLPDKDHDGYVWVSPVPHYDDDDIKYGTRHRPRSTEYTRCGDCHGEIYKEWNSGAHARSGSGWHFRGLYAGGHGGWNLVKERPDGVGVCASCHAPTARPGADLNPEEMQWNRDRWQNSVHCDYCHKIVGPAEGEVGLTHGRYGLKLLRPASGQLLFGPLTDANRNDNAYSPFQKQSRLCASCHEGTVFGIPVYTTYSEWQASPAGRSGTQCQDCHMKPTGSMFNMAPNHGGINRDSHTLANHVFFDGSREEMLKRCLTVDVSPVRVGDGVRVVVTVRADGVGHRVPTGFVDRNVVLVLNAIEGSGKSLPPVAGPVLPAVAGKAVAGKAGRLYAKQLKDFDGRVPAPFWRADPDVTDTRLTPGEPDAVTWRFPAGTAVVRVTVLHRRFWPEVAEAKGWTDTETTILDRSVKVP